MFSPPTSRLALGKADPKPLSDKEKAEKAEKEERKQRVEALYSFQEKVDALQKLQMELELARHAAAAASPAVFGLGIGAGGATPHLGIGQMQGGLAGLVQRGGADLASTQAKLAHWLAAQNPEMAHMSNERMEMVERYAQVEYYLRAMMQENQLLQNQNAQLQRTIAQARPYDHFDSNVAEYAYDGSDPLWEEEQRRERERHRRQRRLDEEEEEDRRRRRARARERELEEEERALEDARRAKLLRERQYQIAEAPGHAGMAGVPMSPSFRAALDAEPAFFPPRGW